MLDPNVKHTLLIANRGEIAVRIIKTARKLGIRTVSIYTPADAIAPHVAMADIAVALPLPPSPSSSGNASATEGAAYLNPKPLIEISKAHNVTLVHPGYGFLSENAKFAEMVVNAGMAWVGPSPNMIRVMGMKHEARKIVRKAASGNAINGSGDTKLRIVPGSEGLLKNAEDAEEVVRGSGLPVIFKASAGGGGLGMIICEKMDDVRGAFENATSRAKSLFGDDGIFVERYIPLARHVEVQVFGDGLGNVVHMGERECSAQRRHQKIIEESPSPFLEAHPGLREEMCDAAVALCRSIKYESAGTVEFIVDDETGDFYFLEMNTRIQVEHPTTEVVHLDLDLIELMLHHAIATSEGKASTVDMNQATYDDLRRIARVSGQGYAIEGRVYAENPAEGFLPSPGLLQHVQLEEKYQWLRIDGWVSAGMQVTPHFDPLLCKIIVHGTTREETISRFIEALLECKIYGPPNNMDYLRAVANNSIFRDGKVTTKYLDTFSYTPNAIKVIESGLEATVQDLPGRTVGKGIPRSGPMDPVAFSIGNILAGNERNTEGIEMIVVPGVSCCLRFLCPAVVAITGRDATVKLNGIETSMWSRVVVHAGGTLTIEARTEEEGKGGLRTYLSIRGGFPSVAKYLDSKSTSIGLGGYQGRPLMTGDFLTLGDCLPSPSEDPLYSLPREMIPPYPRDWTVGVLPGPHGDEDFLTGEGIKNFYSTCWQVSPSSNRMGIRLESSKKIQWARTSGGEGGAHPSNILDNAYAFGSVNVNGDTPVVLTNEGPDMGGYVCLCTVATGELWKLGQLSPGSTVQFFRVSQHTALRMREHNIAYLDRVEETILGNGGNARAKLFGYLHTDEGYSPRLYQKPEFGSEKERFVLRQMTGDSGILAEFGIMELDFFVRAKIQVFLKDIEKKGIRGITSLSPCIRSLMVFYDSHVISQVELLQHLIAIERGISNDLSNMTFPGRKITFPIVLDDPWSKDATERYMRSIREVAVYLPSNVEYLAKNNGIDGSEEALQRLISSDWIVFGVGFYFACPFLVPINPLSRLTGQKLNPSRTFTPRGAVGIAGPVAAIYPVESPGGYQLFGRSLPAWQTWGKGENFHPNTPWLLEPFDQFRFQPVDIEKYNKIEELFDQGRYAFKIEPTVFSMKDYSQYLVTIKGEIAGFRKQQQIANEIHSQREQTLLLEWEQDKAKRKLHPRAYGTNVSNTKTISIKAMLFASVWKILCEVGDVVPSSEMPLLILEAMKSEVAIRHSPEHTGKTIKAFGPGIMEGALVKPGDILIILE